MKAQRIISLAATEIDDQKIVGFLKNDFIIVKPRILLRLAVTEVCVYFIPFLAAHSNGVLSIQGFVMVFRKLKAGGVFQDCNTDRLKTSVITLKLPLHGTCKALQVRVAHL